MCMSMLDRRVQILLDEPRYRKVAGLARRRHVSVATVIREAIDDLPGDDASRRTALARVLAAEPMPVPVDPGDLKDEIAAAHRTHEAPG
jgi:hypothetical protein